MRPLWRAIMRIARYVVSVVAVVVVFVIQFTGAVCALLFLLPGLYRIYRQQDIEGVKNNALALAHILRHAFAEKMRVPLQTLGNRLSGARHRLSGRTYLLRGREFHHHLLRFGAIAAIGLVVIVNILLPALRARADSPAWSTNADFINNKVSKCQPAVIDGIAISGGAYTDPSCAANGMDATMSLPGSGTYVTNVKAVSAGNNFTVALKKDGTVWAWGSNFYGQLGDGTNAQAALPVQVKDAAGTGYLTGVSAITTGGGSGYHAIALKDDGTVWAWGYNSSGQLGDGTMTNRNLPVQVKDAAGTGVLTGAASIAGGGNHIVVSLTDGTAWAWGYNNYGQLGDATTTNRSIPVQVKDVTGADYFGGTAVIAAGGNQTVAIRVDGTVWAWGYNNLGQLGDGTITNRSLPIQVKDNAGTGYLSGVTAITGGNGHVVTVKTDGTIWAWGGNQNSQLGITEEVARMTSRRLPAKVLADYSENALADVQTIVAGSNHSIILKPDGTVWAWGSNGNGQLGDGTTTQRYLPVQVKDATGNGYLTGVTAIAAGNSFTIALKTDGTVWAWGSNGYGQLGDNTTTQRNLPVQVKDSAGTGYLTSMSAIAGGGSHAIAVKNDGTVWAWGYNTQGQLGDNTINNRSLPVQVKDPTGSSVLTGVSTVTGGANHTAALKTDGTVWAWGYNFHGQLGDGTTTQRNLPVQVKDTPGTGFLTGVSKIVSGSNSFHNDALKNDGSLWAWGNNNYGQLGDNTLTNRNLPIQVKDSAGTGLLTSVASIGVGGNYTVASKIDGTAWALGQNNYGQLGDNSTTNRSLPVQVKNAAGTAFLSGVQAVTAGYYHTFGLKADGSLAVWGWNSSGQFGNWSGIDSILPTSVLSGVVFTGGYATYGSAAGYVFDAGDKRRAKWHNLAWTTDPLPAGTSVTISVRNSQDSVTWSSWSDYAQNIAGTSTHAADLSALPAARFIELKVTLMTSGSMTATPAVRDFTLQMLTDIIPPVTNAGALKMYHTNTSAGEIVNGGWNNAPAPMFSWDAGADDPGGAGIAGYCLYLGQDSSADVTQTKGAFLGNSPQASSGLCQYAVSGTSLDLSADGTLAAALPTSSNPYYLLVKAYDSSNNIYAGSAAQFSFKHDVDAPNNLAFVSLPGQFVSTKDVTMTWPTSGAEAANDVNAGLAGIQYRIGTGGTWYGASHNGNQDITDVLSADGVYRTDPTYDYPLLNDGNNMIYFRAIDNAGNVSKTLTTAVIKLNTTSPSGPQLLAVAPSSNTINSFAFNWSAPTSFVGLAANITYCYAINTLPTDATCTYTSAGQTNLLAGAYATQPGDNTFYVVAKDEAGNINYATAASVKFTANTAAPGIPLNVEIADVSVRSKASWKLALSWESPTDTGAGVASYRVFRSLVGPESGYAQVATTQGDSYVDTNLSAVTYYYKIRACDSANNCGAETAPVTKLPTGRFTVAAETIGTPSVQVGTRKATIRWTTERNSDSWVQYGTRSGEYLPGEVTYSEQTKVHSVELTGLEAGKTYYYKAKWTDEDGNVGRSGELMFTTLPAPAIKDVTIIKKSLNSAVVQFTSTDAVNVKINFGKSPILGGLKVINTSVAESTYTVELDGLDDGTTYYLRPDGTDTDGFTYEGNALSFSTPPRPRITNLRFQPIAGEPTSTQKVTWQTNVPTSSMVTYGLDATNGTDSIDSKLVTEHAVTVKDLKDNSNYFLLAQSRDADGNLAVSDRQTFRTALDTRSPKISDVNVEASVKGTGADARGQIVVTWKTDEPTTSQVAYGQGSGANSSYTNSTIDDTRLQTEHTVVISDLHTSSVYYLQPVARDGANNLTKGDEQSAIIGRPTDNVMTIILNALYRTFGL